MSTLAIFLYGVFVFVIVSGALGLIAYGIVADRGTRSQGQAGRRSDGARAGAPGGARA